MPSVSRFVLALCLFAAAAGAAHAATLLAHYPLQSDGLDATGLNGAMILTNAPLQDGGVYCNGIYPGGDPAACVVQTPQIANWDPHWCTVKVEFMISEHPTTVGYRPLLMCGASYRWLGVAVWTDGEIAMYQNGIATVSDLTVSLDVWHEVMIVYDGVLDRGTLYLDGEWACEDDFAPNHGDDRNICTHNGSSGRQFLGLIRNIKVYDEPMEPMPAEALAWGAVKELFR